MARTADPSSICARIGQLSDEELYVALTERSPVQAAILDHAITAPPSCAACAARISTAIQTAGHRPGLEAKRLEHREKAFHIMDIALDV